MAKDYVLNCQPVPFDIVQDNLNLPVPFAILELVMALVLPEEIIRRDTQMLFHLQVVVDRCVIHRHGLVMMLDLTHRWVVNQVECHHQITV